MNASTLLYRQVSPSWVQQGRVTSQVFKPTAKDNKRLSVYDGDLIAAEAAWLHYTTTMKFASVGVMAVTVDECTAVELSVQSDPRPFPEHALICFDACSTSQIEKNAKKLRSKAETRGWRYRAESD